ncbi:hypothetical protein Mkiyose1665_10810 [Mycobacterium kiyosense]|uniref:Prokaryotic cytochrome C oxidase subunit IV family protein n=1 Tax=Mycobacterium kiyosense TaxID=2871094 RepID=A0AA37PWD9_9MYCO|nr:MULTISPECIES: cytochrome C oxidase subunit IV family protein [Mycobacterium]GLB85421.1 hypothetical protein SRL2020028_46770 [Mycobacterium kiyosense]GLB96233.1 hypothetical protein SRL2020226_30090 [Mycobacterium kiyosense]GLD40581.1 hypothetical protein Mkiyose1665_10810 [Mycobacterium kiyosense]
MKTLLRSRTTLVWLLLVAATAVSWAMGHGVGMPNVQLAGIAIIIVAFAKVGLVVFEFMEIRTAPTWMQRAGKGWIVLVAALLITRVLIPA